VTRATARREERWTSGTASGQDPGTCDNRSMSPWYRFNKPRNRRVCNSNGKPYIRHGCRDGYAVLLPHLIANAKGVEVDDGL